MHLRFGSHNNAEHFDCICFNDEVRWDSRRAMVMPFVLESWPYAHYAWRTLARATQMLRNIC